MTTNLFRKPQWTDAHTKDTFTIPDEWDCGFVEQEQNNSTVPGETMPLPSQDQPFTKPNITVSEGRVVISLNFKPLWAAVYQDLTLQVGAKYRISVNVLADLVAADVRSGEFRFPTLTQWSDGSVITFGTEKVVSFESIPTQPNLRLGFEVRARHGLASNRFVLSNPVLELVTPAPGSPSPAVDRLALLTTLVTALDVRIGLAEAVTNGLKADRDAILTELLRLRNLPND